MPTTNEAALRDRLQAEGLAPSAWGNGPHDRYPAHEHGYDKVIVVAAGSIRFGLPGSGGGHDLAVGDRLELPAGTVHDAVVGPDGVQLPGGAPGAGHVRRRRPPRRRLVVNGVAVAWHRSGEESPSRPQCGTLMSRASVSRAHHPLPNAETAGRCGT